MSGDAPELTTEPVVDGVVPSQPAISPDGHWVACVAALQRSSALAADIAGPAERKAHRVYATRIRTANGDDSA